MVFCILINPNHTIPTYSNIPYLFRVHSSLSHHRSMASLSTDRLVDLYPEEDVSEKGRVQIFLMYK